MWGSEREMVGDDGDGGAQGWMEGSGNIVIGIPLFMRVEEVTGYDSRPADVDDGDRLEGSEEEIGGLSVKRLCMSGFFCLLVCT